MKLSVIYTAILILLLTAGRVTAADQTNSAPVSTATTTNGTKRLDLSSFQSIAQHNIFDPNRRGVYIRNTGPVIPPVRIDSFSLRGTMTDERQKFAFFDGNSSQYNKVATTSDTIAGYKIAEIGFDHVKLAAAGNQTVNMIVGSQMRRRDNGPWSLEINGEPAPDSAPPAASDKPTTSSHGSESPSDVIQRLMKKHQAENN